MERYVAFLRGMNLGNRRIKNEELRREFEALGFGDVSCFRASGNVIFAAARDDEPGLTTQIEVGLGEALGYEVPVFLRSAVKLRAIAACEPFDASALSRSKGKLQIVFLGSKSSRADRKTVLDLSTDDDRLAIDDRELYWLPRGGMSESELDLNAISAALGPTTIRTKGTVDQIAAKHLSG
jgi:uncharacterized protein (DUF1697 family)